MPLNLPDKLPAIELLKEENIFVIDTSRATQQDIRPLRIVVLNLMPLKITTETDLVRLLSNTPLQVEISFMKIKSHTSKNTPIEHMKTFYTDFDQMRHEKYDGMIITGAPVEQMDFEEVTYWDEITEIFDWARTHVTSTLYICWAAQAGLYHHYGVPKYPLEKKMFGIFEHRVLQPFHSIFRGFDDCFYVPHSRHTEVRREDILKVPELTLLSESKDAGVYMVMARGGREFFVTGHSEYSPLTLDTEYRRDRDKGLPIEIPRNYYVDDDPDKGPLVRWRAHANLLFSNWLNYFVYQETPYNINVVRRFLINKIVQPVGEQQVGMSTPTYQGAFIGIIVYVIITRYFYWQAFIPITTVFGIQCQRRILRMSGHEKFTSAASHYHIYACIFRFGKQSQLRNFQNIFSPHLCMTAMRHIEAIVETTEDRMERL